MAPVEDDVKATSASPAVTPTAAAAAAPKGVVAPVSASAGRKAPVTMEPISDDSDVSPKPGAAPKPLTPPKASPDQAATASPTPLRQSLNADTLPESPFEVANVTR
jgi:hypothetical protein